MSILDFLFPKYCVNCRKIGDYLCANCFNFVSFDVHHLCLVCGKAAIGGLTHPGCVGKYAIDGAFCGLVYNQVVKKLIFSFKYKPYVSSLNQTLLELLYEALIQQEPFIQALESKPLVIPIPLSRQRLRQRGYNQTALLAQDLAKKLNLSFVDCLVRTKDTLPQFGLKREERIKNISGAFGIKKSVILGSEATPESKKEADASITIKSAFLVDDVLTTGTTLLEASKILKHAGFSQVWGISLSRDQ